MNVTVGFIDVIELPNETELDGVEKIVVIVVPPVCSLATVWNDEETLGVEVIELAMVVT